ncbi:hypothetical protein F3Y22_tig00111779pilonHSYRG00347 [Hibiscus syriacus]|uniref:DNA sliding clamp PCNA n=1 Tax=Hibiscus syriacus TaxID=106335 RepID=A0A6A2YFI2_HIBSY|nr:proliferating cell nuclear antigen-like [Hibiscus syriacus]KAE8673687.1 hypothetical protein F3Y22_tig00111779pilonHSYRG00347 [Hibiscus syriacus]
MLEFRLVHGSLLKKVVKAIKGFVDDALFFFTADGVSLHLVEPTKVVVLYLFLSPQSFDHYHCDDDIILGINLKTLYKKLKRCSEGNTLTITAKHDEDVITFTYHRPSTLPDFQDRMYNLSEYYLKRMELINGQLVQLPEMNTLDAIIRMPSAKLVRIFEGLGRIVTVSVTKEKVKFSTTDGDNITAKAVIRQNKDKPAEEATIIELTEPASFTIELRYINSFAYATPLSKTVFISLQSEPPLMLVKYGVANVAEIMFYLNGIEDE